MHTVFTAPPGERLASPRCCCTRAGPDCLSAYRQSGPPPPPSAHARARPRAHGRRSAIIRFAYVLPRRTVRRSHAPRARLPQKGAEGCVATQGPDGRTDVPLRLYGRRGGPMGFIWEVGGGHWKRPVRVGHGRAHVGFPKFAPWALGLLELRFPWIAAGGSHPALRNVVYWRPGGGAGPSAPVSGVASGREVVFIWARTALHHLLSERGQPPHRAHLHPPRLPQGPPTQPSATRPAAECA